MRCALSCEVEAHPRSRHVRCGAAESVGRQGDVTPELATFGRCKLVVMAIETGGRWSDEAAEMIRLLSHAKAREASSYTRCQVALMWERQWTRMLSVTCATAFAASLVEPAMHVPWCRTGGGTFFLSSSLSLPAAQSVLGQLPAFSTLFAISTPFSLNSQSFSSRDFLSIRRGRQLQPLLPPLSSFVFQTFSTISTNSCRWWCMMTLRSRQ